MSTRTTKRPQAVVSDAGDGIHDLHRMTVRDLFDQSHRYSAEAVILTSRCPEVATTLRTLIESLHRYNGSQMVWVLAPKPSGSQRAPGISEWVANDLDYHSESEIG